MDFLDPKKKRAHRIKLFIGYGLMAIALGFGTRILFSQSYGYHRDPKTGEVVQNGLVFINAQPEAAQVKLNGVDRGQTDQRLDIPSGQYDLELSRSGYRTWKRSFTLEGGSIERFVYPLLFPETLKTSDVQLYANAPSLATTSPDRHWLLVSQPGSFTTFDVLDLESSTATSKVVSLPASLLEAKGATHGLSLVDWASDNRHVLLKHSFEGGQEFVLVDIESPAGSVNINKTFNVPLTEVSLRDKKFDLYYLFNQPAKTLQTATLSSRQVTPYLSDVLAFRSSGDNVVVYVTAAQAKEGKVLLRVREGTDSYSLREFPAGDSYVLGANRFDNAWYFAAGAASEQKAYVYKNPVAAIKRRPDVKPVPVGVLHLNKAPEFITFSANARFVAVQAGSQFAVYDAETDRQYNYDSGLILTPAQQVTWMDGHRLMAVAGGKTVVFDYDGTNKQTLSPAVAGSVPLFDGNYKALFNVASSVMVPGRFAITRTELRVTQ